MTAGPAPAFDALLLVAFGGPEGQDEVAPFLERVAGGRAIPAERLAEVASRYERLGGSSPINGRIRSLVPAVARARERRGLPMPVYWGTRNAAPLLADTVAVMREAGVRRALAWLATPYSSYPTCRRYREDIAAAGDAAGEGAPTVEAIRPHHDHPGLIRPAANRLAEAIEGLAARSPRVLFSAHSLPTAMAEACAYEEEVREAASLVMGLVDPGGSIGWEVVWQSRSGAPGTPWMEPDVGNRIEQLAEGSTDAVVVSPIGFPLENFEVVWDLDVEAAGRARAAGLGFARARCVDDDPRFAGMVADLVAERIHPDTVQPEGLGSLGIRPGACPDGCCPGPLPTP